MKKYLQYLLDDIDNLIAEAPTPSAVGSIFNEEDEDVWTFPIRKVKIADLIGLKAEVFPPERLLTDLQVITLVEAITDLWSAWLLHWTIPPEMPIRQHYTVLVKEMEGSPIVYHPEEGGDIHICHLSVGKPCPLGADVHKCHCKNVEESMQHEFDLWEEYVRSQGLDPYHEITPEEEALFEEDMRHRRETNDPFGEDYHYNDSEYKTILDTELTEEEQKEFLFALEMADELLSILLDNLSDYDSDLLPDEDEDELEFPF